MLTELITLNVFLSALLIGGLSYVYAELLTQPERPLNWLFRFADNHLPWWLAKPLITCFTCVAGQWGVWWYIIHHYQAINITELIALPFISMLTANIIHKLCN